MLVLAAVRHLQIGEQLPEDTEEETLQTVGHQAGWETAAEKTQQAFGSDNVLRRGPCSL